MKEFALAVLDEIEDSTREERINALVAEGKTREEAEVEVDRGRPVVFRIGDRTLKAYKPDETQLIFLMATMSRGQSKTTRMAGVINVMLESLDGDDKDWFEERLLTSDRSQKIGTKTLEAVFEHLTTEWFREESSSDGEAV